MLARAFVKLAEFAPFKRALWRAWYGWISRAHQLLEFTFMNFGWMPADGAPLLALEPADEPDRYCIQLYHVLTQGTDLRGRDVLEVGCGRGGGASFLARHHKPARMTGLDLSANAVAFCRWRHKAPGLEFVRGDATALPFADGSFDAVVNVESSHCYPDFAQFLSEVRRVLRPGGVFLYTDFRDRANVAAWREMISAAGFAIQRESDITKNVLAALEADSDRKRVLIDRMVWPPLRNAFCQFAALRGTPIHQLFLAGELVYLQFLLRKTT